MFRTPYVRTPLQRAAASQQLAFNMRRLPFELQERVLGHRIRSAIGRQRTRLRARSQVVLRRNASHNQPPLSAAIRIARRFLSNRGSRRRR